MSLFLAHHWLWLCIATGFVLLLSFVMSRLGNHFYTFDVVVRKFGILDLEFAASAAEIVNIIKGIYLLSDKEVSKKALGSLKAQLYVDFAYMPFAYGAIALLCTGVAGKITAAAGNIFGTLAMLQAVAWLLDIIENIYLLQKIKQTVTPSTPAVHKAFQMIGVAKWGLALTALVSSLSAILYFWLTGRYTPANLIYALLIIIEMIGFAIAVKLSARKNTAEV